MSKKADYVLHPPSGSSVPGKIDANPFMNYPPSELRKIIENGTEEGENLVKVKSALKQWERIYVYPGYPWAITSSLRRIAAEMLRLAEIPHPSLNINQYQDSEVPEGYEGILEGLSGLADNYNMPREDYNRQGERPIRDIDVGNGDYTTPSESPLGEVVVSPRGDGANPQDLEYPDTPGGDSGGI